MVHIGSPMFYKELSTLLDEMNYVFLEGIPTKKNSELGSYKKAARLLHLASQHEALQIPADMSVRNIDMPAHQFRHELKKLPLRDKLKLLYFDLVLKNISTRTAERLRKALEVSLAYSDHARVKLINPENHYLFNHKNKSKLELLIENQRNEIISENFGKYIQENKDCPYRMDIAIVFGDAHMPYIYEKLAEYGFSWKLEKTIEVL